MAKLSLPLMEVHRVSFGYSSGTSVLMDVNCRIGPNEFTVIMGKNGSGKSTLLRLLGGVMPCNGGSISMEGMDLEKMKPKERARRIGFLPQHHKAVFPFTVSDVVVTGRASYISYLPRENDKFEAERAMDLVGIGSLKNRIYTELSGGEQQLVMIARLLAQRPRLLLMDEPISHLDYSNQLRVIRLIKHLVTTDVTVVAVLHDPNMAFLFGDRFIFVHQKTAFEVHGNAWEHELVGQIFHHDILTVEHKGKTVFIPQLS